MTWLRLQADFFQDPKIIRLTRDAVSLGSQDHAIYVVAGSRVAS